MDKPNAMQNNNTGMFATNVPLGVVPSAPRWPSWKIHTSAPNAAVSDSTLHTSALAGSTALPVSKNSCCGSEGTPEQILAGAAISHGRIFFVSSDAVYAIGSRQAKPLTGVAVDEPAVRGEGAPAYLQVVPTELVLKPGQTVNLRARLFDDKGRFLREDKAASLQAEIW